MTQTMSMRQYAKHRGVSAESVSKAVKRGRITCTRDEKGQAKINPETADREWAANADTTKKREPLGSLPDSPAPGGESKGPSVAQAAGILKAYQARLAKLDYDERTKNLINAVEVKQRWLGLASAIRGKVLGIPSKLRQRCPDLTTDQHAQLEMIVREALETLSDA